jgi:hypothetical protein
MLYLLPAELANLPLISLNISLKIYLQFPVLHFLCQSGSPDVYLT